MTIEELDNLKKRRDEIVANMNYHKVVANDLKKVFGGNEGMTINSRYYDTRFSNLVRQCVQFDYEKFLNINTKIEKEFLEVDSKITEAEEALKLI